ncbi:MAG: benzoate-CoA ligase family protein [Acidobacteriota bacterium]
MGAANLFEHLFQSQRSASLAILYEGRQITYEELRAATVQTAETLSALGIGAGDRVGILLNDSPEFITSFVALISLGAIAVPINLALGKHDQTFILRDCGARAAIIEAHAVPDLFPTTESWSELQDLLVVCRNQEPVPAAGAGVSAQAFHLASRQSLGSRFPISSSGDLDAFILYTSGSTGEPKGAVHTQSDIFYTNETFCREVLSLRPDDRLFSSSRLPFAYGLGNSFTFPLLNGLATILCREKPAPEVVGQVFREYRPTIFFGVPVVYRMLLEHHRNGNLLDTTSLRLCVSAGEALPAQLGEEWQKTFGVEVLDGIGSTEMLHMFMSNHAGEARYGSSGKLLAGYQARLIDHEGAGVAAGEVGNLWIRGDSAAGRYWQRPETTAETFVDGWVRTGDLYRRDADDFWWHMGRSDDCFKPTGQWVSPIEVENVLLHSSCVRACAVVEGRDQDNLSCVCAVVLPASDKSDPAMNEQELRALCERELPRFKRPRRYVFVSELPYTATGKLQRFKLREQLRGNSLSP